MSLVLQDTAWLQAAEPNEIQLVLDLNAAGAITSTALILDDPDMPYERYEALGRFLTRVKRASSWWVGDWLIFGEGVYGERYAQAASETGLEEQTLLNYASVARRVPKERRRASLAFSIHDAVAALEAKEQEYWLKRAEASGWSRSELRARMKAKREEHQPPIGDGEPSAESVVEVARAILRDARESEDPGFWLVPVESVERLRAVLGAE